MSLDWLLETLKAMLDSPITFVAIGLAFSRTVARLVVDAGCCCACRGVRFGSRILQALAAAWDQC